MDPSRPPPSQLKRVQYFVVLPSRHPYQVGPLRAPCPSIDRSGCRLPPDSAPGPRVGRRSAVRDIDGRMVEGSEVRLLVEAVMIRKSVISNIARNPISTDGERETYCLSCIKIARLQLHNTEDLLSLNAMWFAIKYPSREASGEIVVAFDEEGLRLLE